MADSPNYGFNRSPRLSANHLAEYLCTRDASQRDAVIRKAKFPRKPQVIAYQQVTPGFRRVMSGSGGGDIAELDALAERLKTKARREEGYNKDEALRCVAAIGAFKETYAKGRWGKVEFGPSPQDVTVKIGGMPVNTRLEPPLTEPAPDGTTYAGGCVQFLASTPDSRKNIEDRRKYVAAIVHWALEQTSTNIEPLPRLCMSFDAFGREITKAPMSHERLRRAMTSSCQEAVEKWDRIAPPAGYDGPDWH